MAEQPTLVIGAGVVGLASAVELQLRGRRVTLIDGAEPGRSVSFGNAGIIATSEIFPVISPAHVLGLPRMLFARDAPAVVRPSALPTLGGWLLRAATTLPNTRQRRIIDGLGALNRQAVPAWRALLAACDAGDLMRERGMVRLVRDERALPALRRHQQRLAEYHLASRMLTGLELRELEPGIGTDIVGGLLHESDAHVRDPFHVSAALLSRFRAGGGRLIQAKVRQIFETSAGVVALADTGPIAGGAAIITAGLRSGNLLSRHGACVPLQAERGYNLMLRTGGDLLSRPVTFQAESCVATPMGDRLRLAGTVEFARPGSNPRWSRAERLAPIAQRYFEARLSVAGAERWVGDRPSLPDSLPAIGRLERAPRIGYAFGHQHLGLTQGAVTARLIAQLMSDQVPDVDCRPFDITRFS